MRDVYKLLVLLIWDVYAIVYIAVNWAQSLLWVVDLIRLIGSWLFHRVLFMFICILTILMCCQEIGALKRLMQLDVSENKLERLPDSIGQLSSLSDLHLSDNQIDYLPDTFGLWSLAISCVRYCIWNVVI